MTRQELSRALVGHTLNEVLPVVNTWNGHCWKVGGQYGSGFDSLKANDVCYITEREYDELDDKIFENVDEADELLVYTKRDFVNLAWGKGRKRQIIARTIFQTVDWQSPETYAYELLNDPETLADIEQEAAKKR